MMLEMILILSLLLYGKRMFLLLETIMTEAKHKTIKLELLTLVACLAYIDGKKKMNEKRNEKTIHYVLKMIDWVE